MILKQHFLLKYFFLFYSFFLVLHSEEWGCVAHELQEADFSFFVIDLKYSKENGVKICEVQPGLNSAFRGAQDGGALIAERLLSLIHHYWSPNNCYNTKGMRDPKLQEKMKSYGWQKLSSSNRVTNHLKSSRPLKPALSSFSGAVFTNESSILKIQNPDLLCFNSRTINKITNKYTAYHFFKLDEQMQTLRPAAASYRSIYTPELKQKILKQVGGYAFVIKPLYAYNGDGVIITTREQLDHILRLLFDHNSSVGQIADLASEVRYWKKSRPSDFLIEQFYASDPIQKQPNSPLLYDPTMRVVVAMFYDKGAIELHFLGRYWKFPPKSINEEGGMTEKHKSKGGTPYTVDVSAGVWSSVREQLKPWLTCFYKNCVGDPEAQISFFGI